MYSRASQYFVDEPKICRSQDVEASFGVSVIVVLVVERRSVPNEVGPEQERRRRAEDMTTSFQRRTTDLSTAHELEGMGNSFRMSDLISPTHIGTHDSGRRMLLRHGYHPLEAIRCQRVVGVDYLAVLCFIR